MSLAKVESSERKFSLLSNKAIDVIDLGFSKDYKFVWDLQKKILADRIAGKTHDSLILVEHDHVITLGRSSHSENIFSRDLPIFEIERGGDATYHGPGQLVMYPVISLEQRGISVKALIGILESSIVRTLVDFGISGGEGLLGKQTGVWVGDKKRKIASIGVAVSHWISYHGAALNVNTDLSYFQKIRPCGFESSIMTSMSKELSCDRLEMKEVKESIMQSFNYELSEHLAIKSSEQ